MNRTPVRPEPRTARHRLLAAFLSLLALGAIAAAVLFLRAVLGGEWPAAVSPAVSAPAVLVLDDAWTASLAANTTQQAMKDAIDAAVDSAAALHANALAWSGRTAGGDALFRDGTGALTTVPAVTDSDKFFSRFDPMQYLVRRAAAAGMQVFLLATDDSGAPLSAGAQTAGAQAADSQTAGSQAADSQTSDPFAAAPAWETALAAKHGLALLAPEDADAQAAETQTATGTAPLVRYLAVRGDSRTALLRADGSPALLAAAVQAAETQTAGAQTAGAQTAETQTSASAADTQAAAASAAASSAGVILGGITALSADGTPAALYALYRTGGAQPDLTSYWNGKTLGETLAVSYPDADGATLYTSAVFLMGTSDPAQPLTMNGAEVPRYGAEGVWGVLAQLALGDNTFTFQNGTASVSRTITRAKAAAVRVTPADDGTPGSEAVGKAVRITDALASALSSYQDSSTIRETLYQGATARIARAVAYQSGTKLTHAYQLSTGDFVRASACAVVDTADAAFTGCTVRTDAATRCTVLDFAGAGTPAVYHDWTGDTLTLTFLSAAYSGSAPAADGSFLTGADVENGDGSFTLTLRFSAAEPLYGWTVRYDAAANTTSLWLKRAPHLSGDAAAPLAGVTVLLDAGHGGDADGAVGAAGGSAPVEKELNLAAAYAAKYRLEQLGAAVLMTRTDDTNPTLGDRVTAMNTQCPDFFIAIHHNSIELTSDVNLSAGTEAYWFYSAGEPLADNLIAQVCAATGRADRSSHYGYYYVTRSNICPAVLLELGFVTNPAEYEACADTQTIWAEGGAIAQAVYDTVAGTDAAAGTQGTGAADSAAAGSADPAEGASSSGSAAGAGA